MPWVRFTKDFDWNPKTFDGRLTVSFKKDRKYFVNSRCAEEALKIEAAKLVLKEESHDPIR